MKTLLPPQINPGDLIAIVSPASPPYGEKSRQYQTGVQYLQQRGYRVLEGQHVLKEYGYLAGTDEERAEDLNAMLRNPDVKAIICSRGGYGTPRILHRIDYEAVRRQPKILVGYSDITSLQLALNAQTGLVSFSGPMVAVEMGKGILPFTEKYFWRILTSPRRFAMKTNVPGFKTKVYRKGVATGRLLGGCLSLINPLIGTPYMPDFTGAILVLEDIGEDVYGIDRYLVQLRYAGVLKEINGLILGQFLDMESEEEGGQPSLTLDQVIKEHTHDLKIPIVANFPYGHNDFKYTLPIGCRVQLDSQSGLVRLLEPAVSKAV
ncbi:LD-carboxypeptidase [candidate division KSB1 bacterium]|nr:LD-carboxypeptidase [candidate division KSB1 bacterium]